MKDKITRRTLHFPVFFQMEPYNSVMTARFQTVIARINSNFKIDNVDNGNVQR